MAGFDAVFVGSGVNSLTGAALLARGGWKVCVLERNEVLGGALRTSSELTAPGFTHELMASWHPLFAGSAAYAELGEDLTRHGLEYLNTELPTATAFPDGPSSKSAHSPSVQPRSPSRTFTGRKLPQRRTRPA